MSYRHHEPVSKQLTIIVGLTVVGFMTFGLTLSFYRNILFEQTLQEIEGQNELLRNTIEKGHRDLEYYRSDQYKDKYAKENFGLMQPYEKVLIIAQEPNVISYDAETLEPSERQEAAYAELLRQMPILEHWKLYFFHREKIEEIKRSL